MPANALSRPWLLPTMLLPTVILWMSMPLHALGVEAPLRMVTLSYSDLAFIFWSIVVPALALAWGLWLWFRDQSGVALAAATTGGWFIGLMVCVTVVGRL